MPASGETNGENWLLDQADGSLEDSARGATPADPQLLGTVGDASFVEDAPATRAVSQWTFRGLAAAAVCVGAFGLWQMTMSGSALAIPDEDVNGLERMTSAPDKSTLAEPGDYVAPTSDSGPRVSIGAACRLHAGCVIGSDGFGFEPTAEGWDKIPQCGSVVIEDDVDVGANVTIDCARWDPARTQRCFSETAMDPP